MSIDTRTNTSFRDLPASLCTPDTSLSLLIGWLPRCIPPFGASLPPFNTSAPSPCYVWHVHPQRRCAYAFAALVSHSGYVGIGRGLHLHAHVHKIRQPGARAVRILCDVAVQCRVVSRGMVDDVSPVILTRTINSAYRYQTSFRRRHH